MTKIITISREFGSGGRQIGQMLAGKLGIPFYDKELIKMAADDIDIEEHIFEMYDQAFMDKHETVHDILTYTYEVPMSDQIFMAQSRVIHRLAQHGPCVIVGRCADYALADYPNTVTVFISGDEKDKIAYLKEIYHVDDAKAKDIMVKTDKKRASYYNYYSSKKWGDAKCYDMCLNSSAVGVEGAVRAIRAFAAEKKK